MAARKVRPIRVEGNEAFIPLTRGEFTVIDASDLPLVGQFNWHLLSMAGKKYAVRNLPGRKTAYMHRVIAPPMPGMVVDHIDGDGLNNRRGNLRQATISENVRNRRISKNNRSGFKGVHLHPETGKWRARIMVNKVIVELGLHFTKEAAHDAYCRASRDLHGKFGRSG